MKNDIFVLDKCEINVDKKLYSEPHVDSHKLRRSKVVPRSPLFAPTAKYTSFKQNCNKLYSGDSFLFLNESFERMNQNQ